MNFYQRRLSTLSRKNFKIVQELNVLDSRIANEVSELIHPPTFYLTKNKDWCNKQLLEWVMSVEHLNEQHARQFILIYGQDKLLKEMGLK